MRLSRLREGEWLVGVGSIVLLGSLVLLSWFRLTESTGRQLPRYIITTTVDGWNGLSHARWLMLVTIVVGLALCFLQATRRAPAVPVTLSLFAGLLGALSVLWLIYRVLISPPGGSRHVGGFIGLIAACTIAYGGWLSVRQEGIAPEDAPRETPTVHPSSPGGS